MKNDASAFRNKMVFYLACVLISSVFFSFANPDHTLLLHQYEKIELFLKGNAKKNDHIPPKKRSEIGFLLLKYIKKYRCVERPGDDPDFINHVSQLIEEQIKENAFNMDTFEINIQQKGIVISASPFTCNLLYFLFVFDGARKTLTPISIEYFDDEKKQLITNKCFCGELNPVSDAKKKTFEGVNKGRGIGDYGTIDIFEYFDKENKMVILKHYVRTCEESEKEKTETGELTKMHIKNARLTYEQTQNG